MKVENHTKSTMILGQLLDREAVAKEQCDVYASALEDVYRKIAALPDSAKHKTVYMELGNKGIGEYGNSYNKDVLWGAILKNLGADNWLRMPPSPMRRWIRNSYLHPIPSLSSSAAVFGETTPRVTR